MPFQHLTTGTGETRQVVALQIEELLAAGIRKVALVTAPNAQVLFAQLAKRFEEALTLIEQPAPRGFGDAILCAEEWTAGEPFVLQLCDHVFVANADESCTAQLVRVAQAEGCSVSAVQPTPESQLAYFGVVGGKRVKGNDALYEAERVLEKPTPTVAEQQCMIPGLRQGNYLGLFGSHALTASVFDLLRERQARTPDSQLLGLTEALHDLAHRERYLAFEVRGQRIDLEGPFGFLRAQLSLALSGPQHDAVLQLMLEEVARRSARGQP